MMESLSWPLALLLGLLAGALLYRLGWLTAGGAAAAALLGALASRAGGLFAALLLLAFVAAGNLLGSPERRRASQVLANGLVPVLALFFHPAGFLGGLGAAAADTVATGVGSRAGWAWRPDRGRVPPGTNAAVSPKGTLALFLTATFVAALAPLFSAPPLAVFLGASAGAILDTLVGLLFEERLSFWTNDLTNAAATLAGAGVALALL